MTITRISDTRYAVVTDTRLADGMYRADDAMALNGAVLRSVEQRGDVRIGGVLRVTLGPKALQAVTALRVGQAVML